MIFSSGRTSRTPQFREDQFRDLFKEEPLRPAPPAAAPKPTPPADAPAPSTPATTSVQIAFDDIRSRLSLLPTGLDAGSQRISPDGKTLAYAGLAIEAGDAMMAELDALQATLEASGTYA